MKLINVAEALDIGLSTTDENYELQMLIQRINDAIIKAALARMRALDIYINSKYLNTIIEQLHQNYFYVKTLFSINNDTCIEIKW